MERVNARAIRRSGVLTFVVATHLLLLLIISSSLHWQRRKTHTAPEIVTFVVPLPNQQSSEPPFPNQHSSAAPTSRPSQKRQRQPHQVEEPISNSRDVNTSDSISIPNLAPDTPKIDPQLEIQIAVQTMLPDMVKAEEHRCAEAERAHAPRPFGCKQRYYDQHFWQPSGNFLKDIRDPERPRGGTPDPLPDAFGKAPRPQAFRPE